MSIPVSQYREALPQLGERPFLTDGGLETTMVFIEDWELPEFAAFVLLDSASGVAALTRYFRRYIELAVANRAGLILESPTWRASQGWGQVLGYSASDIAVINQRAIEHLSELRDAYASRTTPMVISGCMGPEDDGYSPSKLLSVDVASAYHTDQARAFAGTCADMLCGITLTYVEEAIGMVRAAQSVKMPIAISFTVETDGRLPSGDSLAQAITAVDQATNHGPAYYMINCAHPTHFESQLHETGDWVQRIAGVRANASCMSHAELDAATELDAGNPAELASQYQTLQALLPNLNVLGGCCGTDHRHIEAIAGQCLGEP